MNGKPRRRRSYAASKMPDFNAPLEKWVEYLKLDKSDKQAIATFIGRREAIRRMFRTSDK